MTRALIVAVFALFGLAPRPSLAQLACCSRITAIDQTSGLVTATASPSGTTFLFTVRDRVLLARLKVNQQLFADFTARTVGLDARTVCCTMTGTPTVPSAATARAPAPSGVTAPVTGTAPASGSAMDAVRAATPVAAVRPVSLALPSIAYGTPYTRPARDPRAATRVARFEQRTLSAQLSGRAVSATVLQVRGIKGIEQVPGLADGARRLLLMHVRTIPREQLDHYVINPQLAADWVKDHPVPDYVKVKKPEDEDCENFYDSFDCAGQAVSDGWKRAWEQATAAWNDVTGRLIKDLQLPTECFKEQRLTLADVPVRFAITPSMTVDLSSSSTRGSASGTLSGSTTVGIPMQADLKAQLDFFYIPCLPFAFRPRSVSGDGLLTVGEDLKATVTATGQFDKTFTIPPTGGPVIPIQVYPIVIGGVPVSEVDISAYIEGNIQVIGTGKAQGSVHLLNTHPTRFTFSCGGSGCGARPVGTVSTPATTTQGAQLQGQVTVKPAIYTALQLNFNYEALSARAGPQPYLEGVANGCVAASATQTGGTSSTQQNHALTADLDWGADLRAEVLVMRNFVSEPFKTSLMNQRHIWYRDIAPGGSTALAATIDSTGPALVSQSTRYRVRMPTCYPYASKVQARVTWTGNAVPLPLSECQWSAGSGTCAIDPRKELVLGLTWPSAGTYALTVTTTGDAHGRAFTPAPSTQVAVQVR